MVAKTIHVEETVNASKQETFLAQNFVAARDNVKGDLVREVFLNNHVSLTLLKLLMLKC